MVSEAGIQSKKNLYKIAPLRGVNRAHRGLSVLVTVNEASMSESFVNLFCLHGNSEVLLVRVLHEYFVD